MLSLSEKLLLTDWAVAQGIKVFWVEHDRIGNWLRRNPWLKELLRLSTKVTTVCVSELSRKMYIELGFDASKVVAIANGIDMKRLEARGQGSVNKIHSDHSSLTTHHSLRLGCIARLSEEKGVDVLVAAMRSVPGATLQIVGTGRDEGYIRKLIAELAEHESMQRIELRPSVESLADFYAGIDVLILPSRDHDPFGMVAAEAMMLGVPVIVTDACGIAGYLHAGENSEIAEADSIASLVQAIKKMEDGDHRLRLGKAGQLLAQKEFGIEKMVDRFEELLA